MMKIRKMMLLVFILSYDIAFSQDDASSFLTGFVEAYNRQINNLNQFISQDARCYINGIQADTSALLIFSQNFAFLKAVYPHSKLTLKDVVADRNTASAEWIFSDSTGEVGKGAIIINIDRKKIATIKIYNGTNLERSFSDNRSQSTRSRVPSRGKENQKEASWWYYLRFSLGGFLDPAGVHFSPYFECESPGMVPGKFTKSNLRGPYDSRPKVATSRQSELNNYQSSGNNMHSIQVNCSN